NKRRYTPRDCENQKDSYPQWIVNGWLWLVRNHRGEWAPKPRWFNMLAMRKIAITTPSVLSRLARVDKASARPYNFVLSPMQIFEGPTLIGPFSDDSSRWTGLQDGVEYISVEDGKTFRIC